MSVAQTLSDRRTSPLLSNNPFRNKIPSGPTSPAFATEQPKPVSTNPFLDSSETAETVPDMTTTNLVNGTSSPPKKGLDDNTAELFENLSVDNRPQSQRRGPPPQMNGASRRPENLPPRPSGQKPASGHRPTQSEEDRKRNAKGPRDPPAVLDIFADPPEVTKLRERRPRRNSESSVRDQSGKPLDPEDEKRQRERRHKEREERRARRGKPSRRLDIIDKLDVTSIYGTGLFHHDGPFDACNPHRNRKGSKQAPMQAFPKDSRNMQIGGSGPNNSRLNLDQIHGTGQEAHIDYNEAAVVDDDSGYLRRPHVERSTSFNPGARVEPLHGEESIGLGTSTFLEGAPASRAAIARRESENEAAQLYNGGSGITRKKSLAQKIRGVRSGSNFASGRMTSPEPTPTSPLATAKSESNANPNVNPFFKDYDKEYERKGQQITFAQEQEQKPGRARAPSSPRRGLGLERKTTAENMAGEESKTGGGGLMSRMKSLKGRSKPRPQRRDTSG